MSYRVNKVTSENTRKVFIGTREECLDYLEKQAQLEISKGNQKERDEGAMYIKKGPKILYVLALEVAVSEHLKESAIKKVQMFYGLPPYNTPANPCYGDGYFATSIKNDFGMEVQELAEAVGITPPKN